MSNLKHNVSLKPFNTFGLDVLAKRFISITSESELIDALKNETDAPIFILGGGSNVLLTQDIDSTVFHINIKGKSIIEETENTVIVSINAGENWHQFVQWCLDHNFGGIENLSLIPGNVGTAPMQNIGAYGVELKNTFVSCEAIHIKTQEKRRFTKDDCNFGYRESVFKKALKGQYIITSVNFCLTKHKHVLYTDYGAIQSQLELNGINKPTIQDISKAVITIRQQKLPDPKIIGNSGSFFKNPVVSNDLFQELKDNFPEIPSYTINEDSVKIPAGWLIEKAGFKGKRFGNYGVHKNQALVLVNYDDAEGSDILQLAKLIQKTILRIFKINIETEVNII
ncbi:UDP-N-acetylmuramate dehydrogenase [Ichthyenterobacterium sp. W332]|uniref:UDP-N-acetylenolpyruvoylglucosamine reductase n=1 Tax=Microcosmobacter mediterraneus TaxID=3075607 RepID=A0ABU2YJF9_9FLAO|nr:UDP-N-acetylmuramate dehydrogenase [Ichthyenterobacterium sp. W332]MDT0558307.1 UDP-N-acetylmuramate dehydrogenase [Ichthyenterobacterium sp. W332]